MKSAFGLTLATVFCFTVIAMPARADWAFNGSPSPSAFVQTDKMTLELQCDRIRFAPASYEDARDITDKQALSIRFMKDGATETGAFQTGADNAQPRIVDNFPVEVIFQDTADYGSVLEQIGRNAVLSLAMIDEDVSYGIFDLKGSGAAIKSLRAASAHGTRDACTGVRTASNSSCRSSVHPIWSGC